MPRSLLACGSLALAVLIGVAAAGPCVAEGAAPTSIDECLKLLQALVADAHAIDLLDDQIDHAEAAIARMERHCLASEFNEAKLAADEVQAILATNK